MNQHRLARLFAALCIMGVATYLGHRTARSMEHTDSAGTYDPYRSDNIEQVFSSLEKNATDLGDLLDKLDAMLPRADSSPSPKQILSCADTAASPSHFVDVVRSAANPDQVCAMLNNADFQCGQLNPNLAERLAAMIALHQARMLEIGSYRDKAVRSVIEEGVATGSIAPLKFTESQREFVEGYQSDNAVKGWGPPLFYGAQFYEGGDRVVAWCPVGEHMYGLRYEDAPVIQTIDTIRAFYQENMALELLDILVESTTIPYRQAEPIASAISR